MTMNGILWIQRTGLGEIDLSVMGIAHHIEPILCLAQERSLAADS